MKKGIEYADKSWNPFTGCEMTGCQVGKNCWAYKMSKRLAGRYGYYKINPFQPTFHPYRLGEPQNRKKPTRFNTCFMGDIAYAKKEWLQEIIEVMEECPQHRFYILTKRPDLLAQKNLFFPENAWLGVSVNQDTDKWRITDLFNIRCHHRWVSFEPVYGDIKARLNGIDWVVIGAQSNPSVQPESWWVDSILKETIRLDIPVFGKPNLTIVSLVQSLPPELKEGFNV